MIVSRQRARPAERGKMPAQSLVKTRVALTTDRRIPPRPQGAPSEPAPGLEEGGPAPSGVRIPPASVGSAARRDVEEDNRNEPGSTMAKVIEGQPIVDIRNGGYEIIQHESLWLDTQGFTRVVLNVRCLEYNSSILYIESSELPDGSWATVTGGTINSEGTTVIVLTRELARGETNRLQRYLRWRINNTTGETCFSIRAELY